MEKLKIEGANIVLAHDSSMEDLIVQLQPYIPDRVLCVIDGTRLQVWTDMRSRPKGLIFEGYAGDIYSFRDPDDHSYVVFGLESATLLHPPLNEHVYVTARIRQDHQTHVSFTANSSRAEIQENVMNL